MVGGWSTVYFLLFFWISLPFAKRALSLSEYARILEVDEIKLQYCLQAVSSKRRCCDKWRRGSQIEVVSRHHTTRVHDAQHSPPTSTLELLGPYLLSRSVLHCNHPLIFLYCYIMLGYKANSRTPALPPVSPWLP